MRCKEGRNEGDELRICGCHSMILTCKGGFIVECSVVRFLVEEWLASQSRGDPVD